MGGRQVTENKRAISGSFSRSAVTVIFGELWVVCLFRAGGDERIFDDHFGQTNERLPVCFRVDGLILVREFGVSGEGPCLAGDICVGSA